LVPFLHGSSFFHPDLAHDEDFVVFFDLFPEHTSNGLMLWLVHEVLPFDSPDTEPSAALGSFVVVLRALIVSDIVSTNQDVVIDSKNVRNLSIDLKADVNSTSHEEDNLIHFIKFFKHNFTLSLMSWLKLSEEIKHEISILRVLPSEESWLIWALVISEAECSLVVAKEIIEKEILVHDNFGIDGKLIKYFYIFITSEGCKFVFLPSVLEVIFKFSLEISIKRFLAIKFLNSSKKFGESIAFI
jgi:hypothetical protein